MWSHDPRLGGGELRHHFSLAKSAEGAGSASHVHAALPRGSRERGRDELGGAPRVKVCEGAGAEPLEPEPLEREPPKPVWGEMSTLPWILNKFWVFNVCHSRLFTFFCIGVFIVFPLPNRYLVLFMTCCNAKFCANPLSVPNFPPSMMGFAFDFLFNVRLN